MEIETEGRMNNSPQNKVFSHLDLLAQAANLERTAGDLRHLAGAQGNSRVFNEDLLVRAVDHLDASALAGSIAMGLGVDVECTKVQWEIITSVFRVRVVGTLHAQPMLAAA